MKKMSRYLVALTLTTSMVGVGCGDDDGSSSNEVTEVDQIDDPVSSGADAEVEPSPTSDAPTEPADEAPAEPEPTATAEPVQKSLTIGLQLEPPTLDLTTSPAAAIPQVLLYNVYETLVRLNADGSISPLLAESFEISDDGLTYTFELREGISFHNGDPLTASDVVYSFTNVFREDSEHPFSTTFAPIAAVEASDDHTVVVTTHQPSANLLFFMAQGQGAVLNEEHTGQLENSANGTGPFSFAAWTPGDSIELARNDQYWGEKVALDDAKFRYINDENALTNAMLAEDIDILAGVSAPELLVAFETDERFDVVTGQTYGEVVLSLNGRNAPLDDVRVRQAISHAINDQDIVDLAYAGYGTPIGTFSTPLDPWYQDLTDVYPFDPDRSRELLAEAGAEGIELRMVLPPTTYATRSGEIIQSQLSAVGVDVKIENVEWGVWLEDVFKAHDYDMSIVAHVEPNDLAQYGNPDYYWGDDSPAVASLVERADAETGGDSRNALYRQALEEITRVAADDWLFVLPALSVTRAEVSGYSAESPALALDLTHIDVG